MMFLRMLPLALIAGGILHAAAGRWDVPAFWAYSALIWLMASTLYTVLQRRSPELVAERLTPPSDRDRRTRIITVPVVVLHHALAGIDVGRRGWTQVALPLQLLGFALIACSLLLVGWTLLSNPFASSAVRIQREREQTVITGGPYAWVRHPMYSGVVLFTLGSGWALGSWIAWAVLLPMIPVFMVRTLREERMLRAELPGYEAYTRRTRWRMVPGLF